MTYKLYAQYDCILARTGPVFKNLAKAKAAAARIASKMVEVREVTAKGTEQLVTVFKAGIEVVAPTLSPFTEMVKAYDEIRDSLKNLNDYADEAIARAAAEPETPITLNEKAA